MEKVRIFLGDNLEVLKGIQDKEINLIYIDPPFNTGSIQKMERVKNIRKNKEVVSVYQYDDNFEDYGEFIYPRLIAAKRVLRGDGQLFVHLDSNESHYVKIILDEIFGRENYKGSIIWHWDYGAKSKKKWSCKHNEILWYVKDPENYTFNYDAIDRIPYMAPGLVGPVKAAKGKIPTNVWFFTIVPTNSKERTGYATQKPLKLLERIVKVHSNLGDLVLDFFAGSGTTGEAALLNDRRVILIDSNLDSYNITKRRLEKWINKN